MTPGTRVDVTMTLTTQTDTIALQAHLSMPIALHNSFCKGNSTQ